MRRPLSLTFLFFAAGICMEYLFSPAAILYALPGASALALFFHIRRQTRTYGLALHPGLRLTPLFLAVFIAGGLYCGAQLDRKDPLEGQVGALAEIRGTVVAVQAKKPAASPFAAQEEAEAEDEWTGKSDYHKVTVSLRGGPSVSGSRKILVNVAGADLEPADLIGAEVTVRGRVSLPATKRNPGCFDYRLYLKTMNIRVILSCNDNDITVNNPGRYSPAGFALNRLASLKYALLERLREYLDAKNVGILAGMLFGDKSLMDEDLYEAFQKNGTAHILSVSGIHVAIIYACVIRLLGNRRGPFPSLIVALTLLLYAAMAEFAPSVVRASVMILTHVVAMLLRRRYDLLTGACAAAGAMLLWNPLQLFHTGFQLSFLAIFTMAFSIPFLDRYVAPTKEEQQAKHGKPGRNHAGTKEVLRMEAPRRILRGALPLFAIQAGMAPYTAYVFNYFSLSAFVLNIPVIFLANLIIPIGAALLFLLHVSETAFGVGASAAEILINMMTALNDGAAALPWGHMSVTSPLPGALVLYYGLFFLLSSESFRVAWARKNKRALGARAVLLLFCLALTLAAPGLGRDRSALVFVDVGQGDCLHIRTPDGKNILIDSGGSLSYSVGKNVLLPYLLKNGVKQIDLALITHLHTDHYLGLVELANEFPVKKLAVYEGNRLRQEEILRDTGLDPADLLYIYAGERLTLGKDVYVDVLFPEKQDEDAYERLILTEEDENKSSLLMKLVYRGVSALMTGDLGFEGEDALIAAWRGNEAMLRCDLLKVGHHGSRYSTGDAFLRAVAPRAAVFQVGATNTFGHPHPTVLEKCEKSGIMIFRNDQSGAILFRIGKDGEIGVRTVIPSGG
ncbi:MAG: DNA internalization-related competence protein ComEC/Rec2 [Clostridiales Family XIII bacterium]|jgi:competence protein ComEC|nr:DNA internalization-related competence protein ComEC/Rec2 [Clostridiales Family XIII bacterium]